MGTVQKLAEEIEPSLKIGKPLRIPSYSVPTCLSTTTNGFAPFWARYATRWPSRLKIRLQRTPMPRRPKDTVHYTLMHR